ncbi:zinc-ribbon domain-containing protein [Georgenia thermotolerans]|nr:zinc-ribbon domain-containing protein [Georgenia thermotolerans]
MRIELSAVAEIAHIDHSTGEVQIARGRSTVPLGAGTGVLTSADGVVATTWENLDVDEDAVAVYAANELFTKVIGVPVVGNDGDPARKGTTPDLHWGPHLQHCYQQVTHCILFVAPQYRVLTYTTEPGGSRAELLNAPSAPTDVALLRITGGGGAPTARLAATDADPASETDLVGFAGPPGKDQPPQVLPVTADGATKQITAKDDLAGPLRSGLSGGPVLDRASGDVVGLAAAGPSGAPATLVPAAAVAAAMEQAGVDASPSPFDGVFRRGVDHLAQGNADGAASELQESLTYYDSALAAGHLDAARAQGGTPAAPAAASTGSDDGPSVPLLVGIAGAALAVALTVVVLMRRRGSPAPPPVMAAPPPVGSPPSAPAAPPPPPRGATVTAAAPPAARRDERPAAPEAAAEEPGPAPPAGTPPAAEPTRTAGTQAPRAAAGATPSFCPECGTAVTPRARFCTGCGTRLGDAEK